MVDYKIGGHFEENICKNFQIRQKRTRSTGQERYQAAMNGVLTGINHPNICLLGRGSG